MTTPNADQPAFPASSKRPLDPFILIEHFCDEEEWIEAECAAMEKAPEKYNEDDRIGLPYLKTCFEALRSRTEKTMAALDRKDHAK